jgi:phosphoglycolate phosphatase
VTKHLPRIRAVLFDLDGTLIDSAPDLAASLNIVLARSGLGPVALADVIGMIGDGIRKLAERGFARCGRPIDGVALDAAHDELVEAYRNHLTDLTVLLPAARETLVSLWAAGIPIGLVTNKPQRETEAILDHFGLAAYFGAVIGGDAGFEKKPAPDMLLAALKRLGATSSEALMIGDGQADVRSARAAGVNVILVRGGYTAVPVDQLGADAVVDSLGGVVALVIGDTPDLADQDWSR